MAAKCSTSSMAGDGCARLPPASGPVAGKAGDMAILQVTDTRGDVPCMSLEVLP
jgi:hypothetical protein